MNSQTSQKVTAATILKLIQGQSSPRVELKHQRSNPFLYCVDVDMRYEAIQLVQTKISKSKTQDHELAKYLKA